MKKLSITLFLLILFIGFAYNQENKISVLDFKHIENSMDARVNFYKQDQNGDKCAIIKVVTTQDGLEWEGDQLGIVATVQKSGEYWLYVPHGVKRLTIKHADIGVLRDYIYPMSINEAMVYELILDVKSNLATVNIRTNPASDIYIDNVRKGFGSYSGQVEEGDHLIEARKDKHISDTLKQFINKGEDLDMTLSPWPITGNLHITSNPSEATIKLNEQDYGKTPYNINQLLIGEYNLTLEQTGFFPIKKAIEIKEGETLELNEVFKEGSLLRYTKRKKFFFGTAIVTGSIGAYFAYSSNKHYKEYQTATDNATELHEKIVVEDIIWQSSFGLTAVALIPAIINMVKENKIQKNLNITAVPVDKGLVFGLSYKF